MIPLPCTAHATLLALVISIAAITFPSSSANLNAAAISSSVIEDLPKVTISVLAPKPLTASKFTEAVVNACHFSIYLSLTPKFSMSIIHLFITYGSLRRVLQGQTTALFGINRLLL